MPYTTMILTSQPIPFAVRRVKNGDTYGKDGVMTHDTDDPLIEFFDMRYLNAKQSETDPGQFISRYYESSLMEGIDTFIDLGLNLDGAVPDWQLNGKGMRELFTWLDECQDHDRSQEQMRALSRERSAG